MKALLTKLKAKYPNTCARRMCILFLAEHFPDHLKDVATAMMPLVCCSTFSIN